MQEVPVAPPQNLEAERELLGALLAYYTPRIVDEIAETGLAPEDFYWVSHASVFDAIQGLHAEGAHVDVRTVARRLGARLEATGGMARLEALLACCVPYGVVERAGMIQADSEWRRKLSGLYDAIDACHARDLGAYEQALRIPAGVSA